MVFYGLYLCIGLMQIMTMTLEDIHWVYNRMEGAWVPESLLGGELPTSQEHLSLDYVSEKLASIVWSSYTFWGCLS